MLMLRSFGLCLIKCVTIPRGRQPEHYHTAFFQFSVSFFCSWMNIFDPLSVKSTQCGMPALPSITAMLEARMQHQHRGAQRISTYLDLILNIKGFDQPKPHLFLCCHICKHLQTSSVQKC